jgi:hypothetical protein
LGFLPGYNAQLALALATQPFSNGHSEHLGFERVQTMAPKSIIA